VRPLVFNAHSVRVALNVGRTDPAANLNMKVVTQYHMDRSTVFTYSFIYLTFHKSRHRIQNMSFI